MLKAYKYRIYPNKEQSILIEKHFGCTRFVYNWALALQNEYYQKHKKSLSRSDIQSQLVAMKKQEQYAWLQEVNSQSLLNALLNIYTAFQNFFAKRAKFPNFKSKKIAKRSYQCPQHCKLDCENGLLHLPKIKNIKTKISRQFNGKIKTVTISKTATGKYFASVLVENNETLPTPTTIEIDKTIGIDLGIANFLNFSNGTKIDNPRYLQQSENQLAKQQRIFSRKKKDSNNYLKQKLIVARIHEKIKNQRIDLTHKITYKLICENQATSYVLEDLSVKNMIKNRKLAKAIADVAWGQFVEVLSYKAKWYGKNIFLDL